MSRYVTQSLLAMILAGSASFAQAQTAVKGSQAEKPNVVIFLLDDAGFGQIGSFGGSIETPNIDRVASMGLRYSNFHTTALCSPSRAALLTGRNHHSVGTGVIVELQTKEPGYTSRIPDDKYPLVESLRQSGYATAAFGKWHNTPVDDIKPEGPFDLWPTGLGFKRFYGFMGGDVSHWEPLIWDNTTAKTPHADGGDYHFTVDMTDKAIEWLSNHHKQKQNEPFFLYYATGAVHAPHHAPDEYIKKYRGRFDHGWDNERAQILERQIAAGLVPPNTQLSTRPADIRAWEQLSDDEKKLFARMQETFAGFLDHTDAQFGRLLKTLEDLGELDNTIVIVTSDNGASGEGGLKGSVNEIRYFNAVPEDTAFNLTKIDEIGSQSTYNHYPAGWALAGNTPLTFFKQTTNEGGTRVPFILSWPSQVASRGEIRGQFIHLIDVLPTIMDVANVSKLTEVKQVVQKPMEGASFAKTFDSPKVAAPRSVQYFEMLANRAIWQEGWKAVAFRGRFPWDVGSPSGSIDDDPWHLYNIDNDPSEMVDLSSKYPEKLESLKALFNQEALKYNVYPLNDSTTERLNATYQSFTAGIDQFVYGPADAPLHEALSPPVKNRSHSIRVNVFIPADKGDGVIVAIGGRFGGYSLFMKDNRLFYVNNFVGEVRYEVASSEPIPNGAVEIEFDFERTGNYQGIGKLFVNGQLVGEGEISKTNPIVYSIYDTFDIGKDSGSPVSERYQAPFPFTGTIESVEFDLR